MKKLNVDICVIGGGSGGLSTSAIAAKFGVSVVLFEHAKMGGDCLNYGCVPSKALLAAGKAAHAVRGSDKFGVESGSGKADFAKVHKHVQDVIATIAPHDSVERFTGLGVQVIEDGAQFVSRGVVRSLSGDVEVKARKFVIATGSHPFIPPIPGISEVSYFTNENIFENDRLLEHLIIIGGGPIGMEMAQAHCRLGCKVTVLEGSVPLAKDDPELTQVAIDALMSEGVVLRSGALVKKVEKTEGGVRVLFETDGKIETVEGSDLLMSVGRRPNTEGLGLDVAGIELSRTGIKVDSGMRTTNRKVYAIGDVAGGLQFTHMAGYHAGLVIRSALFGLRAKEKTQHIPWVTYVDPEVANVGMNEAAARKQYGDGIKVLRFNLSGIDRAQAERKTDGLIKVIVRANGVVLGAGIVGANAGELIMPWCVMVSNNLKISKMQSVVAAYPTMGDLALRASYEFSSHLAASPGVRRLVNFMKKF